MKNISTITINDLQWFAHVVFKKLLGLTTDGDVKKITPADVRKAIHFYTSNTNQKIYKKSHITLWENNKNWIAIQSNISTDGAKVLKEAIQNNAFSMPSSSRVGLLSQHKAEILMRVFDNGI